MNTETTHTLKVAAVNSWAEPLAIEKNIADIEAILEKLSRQHVQYALFPELSVSGYINNASDLQKYASQHTSVIQQLYTLSEKFSGCFSIGLPKPYKTGWGIAQLTFEKGEIIHTHYKTHLSVHEQEVFVPGTKLDCVTNSGIQTGMLLCLESHYPELALELQKRGSQLLCYAFASPRETPEEKLQRFKILLQARAYDNVCFVMACNQTGKTPSGQSYAGAAMIISPRGQILSECCGMNADYCIAEIDVKDIEKIQNSRMSNFPAYRKTDITMKFNT